jgi:hypothetical protein
MCAGRVWAGTLIEWRGGQWECEPSQQTSCLWSSGERQPRMDCSSNTARTYAAGLTEACRGGRWHAKSAIQGTGTAREQRRVKEGGTRRAGSKTAAWHM